MNKEQLLHSVKSWINIDDDIRDLQREIRAKRKEKKELTETLITTMKSHEIDCFELGQGNKLLYTQHKIKKPLSKKHLLTCLTNYFSGNSADAQNLSTYIMNSRQVNIKDKIKRKTIKKNK
tara:strand:+ start:4224 stop:4586 length:363 start_codon:yes stop_codon:yes gene_type:complete